jgi:hypothetical protein
MNMNSALDLGSETFSDADIAEMLVLAAKDRFVTVFDPKDAANNKQLSLPDFGTVFIGFDSLENVDNCDLFLRPQETPLRAPESWKVGHLVKRLGMFPSASQAAKNGFGNDIPKGFSQVMVRVNKMRGILSIVKA